MVNMVQNLANQQRILDTGNDAQSPAAIWTLINVNGEYPFQSLRPVHGRQWLVMVDATPRVPRHDPVPVLGIGRKNPMKTGQVQARTGDQGRQGAIKSNGSRTTWVDPSRNGRL